MRMIDTGNSKSHNAGVHADRVAIAIGYLDRVEKAERR
jgi:hypothetical protein